jgi:two-component SAPR family response regulator
MKVKCIIVDDEPNAQAILKLHCDKIDFLFVENTFSNAIEAASYLKSNTIDLIFLASR